MPSAGMLSPALTTKTSSISKSSADIVISLLSLITVAVLGAKSIRPLRAFVVFPFEYASSVLPTVIKVKIIADDSKYKSCK